MKYIAPWIPDAPVVAVIGQSPGREEGRQGRPFIGPSGQVMRKWFAAVGLDPDAAVMWGNVHNYFHREDANYVPTEKEAVDGWAQVQSALVSLAPTVKVVILMGAPAAHAAGYAGLMGEMHGVERTWGGVILIPCYHTSSYLRSFQSKVGSGWKQALIREGQIKSVINRTIQILGGGDFHLPEYEEVDQIVVD